MDKKFRFTNDRIKALPANPPDARSTELEFSDTEVIGLRCLSGRSGSKRWLLRYKTQEGRKRSISIGRFPEVDVNAARKIARNHLLSVAQGSDPKAMRDEVKSLPTVSEFFWQIHMPLSKSKNASWRQDEQRFRDYVEPNIGHVRYKDLSVTQVQQLQVAMKEGKGFRQPYAPATCNRVLALLKTMGAHAVRLGIIEINQASKIQLLREDNVRTRFLDLEESHRLIAKAKSYRNKSIGGLIIMLLITGCRWSELRLSRHDNLDIKKRILVIPPSETKNKRGRVVYLTDLAIDVIQSIPRDFDNPYIFQGRLKNRPVSDIRATFRQLLRDADIPDPQNICLHTLRHSTASNMVSAGLSLNAVKAQLAHRSIQSSERYAKLTTRSLQETSQRVTDLFNPNPNQS